MKRPAEAASLLRNELTKAPADAESARQAARLLAFDFQKYVAADDDVLWNWLAQRPKWDYTEERLLWRMLENAPPADLDKHFARAETLAKGQHASRARTLGWIMTRMEQTARALPLLEQALREATDRQLKEDAASTLFGCYLDLGDWKHADALFPDAAKRLTASETADRRGRVAVVAAKARAKADALRIWRDVVNFEPGETRGLRELAAAGLRTDLVAVYGELQQKLPSSLAPAKALRLLEGH